MWYYAAAFLSIAVTAEALGLGGIPAKELEIENMVFIGLLLTLMAAVISRFARR